MAGEAVDGRRVVVEPAVESLLRGVSAGSAWPEPIRRSPALAAQAKPRLDLAARMCALFAQVPDVTTDLGQSLAAGLVTPGDAAQLFEALGRLLEEEPLSRRLILYLPFEWLPDRRIPTPSRELVDARERFAGVFVRRWRELLAISDVRANFVDGDILEPELGAGPPPRVVKAAHLLPRLVEKGLLSPAELGPLFEQAAGEETLLDSLGDGLAVLLDLKLLSEEDGRRLQRLLPEPKPEKSTRPPGRISEARLHWEERRREEAARRLRAEAIAAESLRGPSAADRLTATLTDVGAADPLVVRIQAAGQVIERLAATDLALARTTLQALDALLLELWRSEGREARDALVSLWSRCQALGAVHESHWARVGVRRPRLDATSPDDPDLLAMVERNLGPLVHPPASLADLSRLIYPTAIFFGSRLKGYASHDADLDVAVFVKPGVPAADRPRLQELLSRAAGAEPAPGKIVEFWLEERGDDLQVQDLPDPDGVQAGSDWVHVLLGGAWYGERGAIEALFTRLLSPYLRSRQVLEDGRPARELWLEELERDTLQYRLMHHGYARFHPPRGGIHTASSARIDSSSMFWDSGYRRLASLLYVKRVFLPLLEAEGP